MGYGSADAERSLHDDVERLTRERDEWRRKAELSTKEAENWQKESSRLHQKWLKVKDQNDSLALQNRELKEALDKALPILFKEMQDAEAALALTPTQAERIVEAKDKYIEALVDCFQWDQEKYQSNRGKVARVLRAKAALDAARKGK